MSNNFEGPICTHIIFRGPNRQVLLIWDKGVLHWFEGKLFLMNQSGNTRFQFILGSIMLCLDEGQTLTGFEHGLNDVEWRMAMCAINRLHPDNTHCTCIGCAAWFHTQSTNTPVEHYNEWLAKLTPPPELPYEMDIIRNTPMYILGTLNTYKRGANTDDDQRRSRPPPACMQ